MTKIGQTAMGTTVTDWVRAAGAASALIASRSRRSKREAG
ncbi:MAG: hypothetical protein JWP83_5323 [Mycobacterium sp.]|jgi:hypothetical protein|nr:hypothetical protein [Mycobacterium sp.]